MGAESRWGGRPGQVGVLGSLRKAGMEETSCSYWWSGKGMSLGGDSCCTCQTVIIRTGSQHSAFSIYPSGILETFNHW